MMQRVAGGHEVWRGGMGVCEEVTKRRHPLIPKSPVLHLVHSLCLSVSSLCLIPPSKPKIISWQLKGCEKINAFTTTTTVHEAPPFPHRGWDDADGATVGCCKFTPAPPPNFLRQHQTNIPQKVGRWEGIMCY